jgi:hypothetical protein
MVDNMNPTSQFHPYQPPDVQKQTGDGSGGLGSILSKVGIDSSRLNSLGDSFKNVDVKGNMEKVRSMARSNPGAFLGGLAAVAIGAGLLRRRMS